MNTEPDPLPPAEEHHEPVCKCGEPISKHSMGLAHGHGPADVIEDHGFVEVESPAGEPTLGALCAEAKRLSAAIIYEVGEPTDETRCFDALAAQVTALQSKLALLDAEKADAITRLVNARPSAQLEADCADLRARLTSAESKLADAETREEWLRDSVAGLLPYRMHLAGCEMPHTEFCTCGLKEVADSARLALKTSALSPPVPATHQEEGT